MTVTESNPANDIYDLPTVLVRKVFLFYHGFMKTCRVDQTHLEMASSGQVPI